MTWDDLLLRDDLIGGVAKYTAGTIDYRGIIKSFRIHEHQFQVLLEYMEYRRSGNWVRMNDQPNPLFAGSLVDQPEGHGVGHAVTFQVRAMGEVTLSTRKQR